MKTLIAASILSVVLGSAGSAATYSDVVFAERPDGNLTLDAFVPDGPGPHPTAIIVHGGGWVNGNKQTYVKPLFPVLSDAGFAWFSINYRLAPAHHFPDPAQDVADAIRWVKRNADKYKVDTTRIALVGESAGGHLVSWIGVTEQLGLAAVVPFYAPHDLLGRAEKWGISENVQKLLGIGPELNEQTRKALRNASPYDRVKPGLPPFLLIHGTDDKQVPYDQSVSMKEKLRSAGVKCDLFTVQGGGHGMGSWDKVDTAWKNHLVQWLQQNMPGSSASAVRSKAAR
jgi:acetyl esterase